MSIQQKSDVNPVNIVFIRHRRRFALQRFLPTNRATGCSFTLKQL
jgi:hypothetical protein